MQRRRPASLRGHVDRVPPRGDSGGSHGRTESNGGEPVSFLQKARDAANQAAEQARNAAEQARARASDPNNAERARQAMQAAGVQARAAGTAAKRGLTNLVNPEMLADLIIKSTAIQEKTNQALRAKGSAYRVAEVTITATLPPQIGFAISRLGEVEEVPTGHELDSSDLLEQVVAEEAAADAMDPSNGSNDPGEAVAPATENEALQP
jgi:hypothetical protein